MSHQEDPKSFSLIQTILNAHNPPLEPEIEEYLVSVLADIELDGNESDSDEVDTVRSTLEGFLDAKECQEILDALPRKQVKRTLPTKPKDENSSPATTASSVLTDKLETPSSPPKEEKAENEAKSKAGPTKSQLRKEQRLAKKKEKGKKDQQEAKSAASAATELNDFSSAWQERLDEGKLWGGRGFGGRGLRITGENLANIHLPSVSLQFEGNELLVDSPMDIVRGHRYGLLGRNGVGKSTLLRQLAAHQIPGMPHNMRILIVSQQIQGSETKSTLDALVEADTDRTELLNEQDTVEAEIEQGINLEVNAERLGNIVAELDAIDAESAEERALDILKGLSFTKEMINAPTAKLSGGWRMRLALAQALFVPHSDLILLDEATNHLDLHGMAWLINYLTKQDKHERTLIVVSHDRPFLDAICTDIIVMEHKRLNYHVGNYSEYQRQTQEKATRKAQILDASERQRQKALAFVQNNKKSNDPNKQRQAKMVKDKKLDRIGNYREDGKRYKNFSLAKMDMDFVRLAEKVHIEADEQVLKFRFPEPIWPPGISEGSPLIQLNDVSFAYDAKAPPLLKDLTLEILRGSKIALVGNNGSGKSTLIKLIVDELETKGKTTGTIWRHPSLRIGHVTQYSVEELEEYAHLTVVQYAEDKLKEGKASSTVIKEASGNVRQYLGAFGLGGVHAHRQIARLSGGERMRLCFATVLADQPHILFLDESTNHVDLETLDSMAAALNDYQGSVLMVSHNQGFLSGFCRELWVLEKGHVEVNHDDNATFDELFSEYRSTIMSSTAAENRQQDRRAKANMARLAVKQGAGAKKNATLIA